ncbi:MAG: 3-hexulose-6-phosphate synthase, partial [Candidatus Helarchaeota archaeon]
MSKMTERLLQVALDFMNLERAMQIAREAVKGGVDWLEAGTPLIKSEGMNAVRTLKKEFPEKIIVADMKIMDVGSIEVEMAAKSGANVVIVLGLSDDSTISEAVAAGKKYGAEIMVDMINVENMIERAAQLERLGVDIICVHVGIDQQMRGVKPLEVTKQVAEIITTPKLAIAGGLNSETAPKAIEAGADIIIVGHAITAAQNAAEATRLIKDAMATGKPIVSELFKKYDDSELYQVFNMVSTPNISDAMHRKPAMSGIKPIWEGSKMVGKAVTVRTYPGDWSKTVEAIDIAGKGDVIVIDAAGAEIAVWGELASWSCKVKEIAGVVIDGAVRDIEDIREMKFPLFARHVTSAAGAPKGFGEINVEIECGGSHVAPGDWIV